MIGLVLFCVAVSAFTLGVVFFALFRSKGEDMTVRAKFKVQTIQDSTDGEGAIQGRRVILHPVYSDDPTHENRSFWQATPTGLIDMFVSNPAAFEQFEQGAEYYVTFDKAPS